jgi:hypothetical protein
MGEVMKLKFNSNAVTLMLFLLVAVLLFGISSIEASQNKESNTITKLDSNMLQFKSGSHILGFDTSTIYMVSVDHALSIEFMGTKGVKPKADAYDQGSGQKTKTPMLGKVVYKTLWEGIDLTYEPTKNGLTESTYYIAPGADVSKIKLKYNVPVTLRKDGSLEIGLKTKSGKMTESAPIAWQEINGKKTPVKVSFRIDNGEIGFKVGNYDKTVPLIIDPTYQWHTFYGLVDLNPSTIITVDSNGNVYIAGYYDSEWLCVNGTDPRRHHTGNGQNDLFVIKLDSIGEYKWHTFFGGGGADGVAGIAVDINGNIYITGSSSSSWQGGENADINPIHAYGGYHDIFVLKLNSNGFYQWHTFYGSSSNNDYGTGVATDNAGNVYITGYSNDSWTGVDENNNEVAPIHAHAGYEDAFVLKLNNSGAYQWHTFYGNYHSDDASGIATDSGGNVYVTGFSQYDWGLTQSPLHAFTFEGCCDIYVLKLNGSGEYQWHTFYGAASGYNSNIKATGIAADKAGNIYISGDSYYSWLGGGSTPVNPIHAHSGYGSDVFILKLNSDGAYQWHTFYGGTSHDNSRGIAADVFGNVYLSGYSNASWVDVTPIHGYTQYGTDIFLLTLGSNGNYKWHTFLGTGNNDYGAGVATDAFGNVYVSGNSYTEWNYIDGANNEYAPLNSSNYYGNPLFALKIASATCPDTPIAIGGTYYSTIMSAYNAAATNSSIKMQALLFNNNLVLDRDISVILTGGYNCEFTSSPGVTVINGSMSVDMGTVEVKNISIE